MSMTCPSPTCSGTLLMSDRQGIEIDYCGTCRGVWLDRGELDKIIERSMQVTAGSVAASATILSADDRRPTDPPPQQYRQQQPRRDDSFDPDSDRSDRVHRDQYGKPKKKRGGFLGDLFDF